LSRRVRGRKLNRRSKGFSSIVGAIFMVVIVWILASSYFIWTLSQNTVYNDAIREKNQLESDSLSENVKVTNTTYVVTRNDNVNVSAIINNIGSQGVQFITLWTYANNPNCSGCNFTKLSNVNVQGGANLLLNADVNLEGVRPTDVYRFAAWLITARGNVVPLQESTLSNITVSQVTQGIGALMMDFQNFTYYNVTGSSPNYFLSGYPTGASGYYVQGAVKGQIAFRVILTNLDQNQRSIILTSGSVLFSIFPSSPQATRCAFWYIVNVNSTTGAILNTYTSVTLVYNRATELYFASLVPGSYSPSGVAANALGTTPVNLALIGQIGSDPFGQNIPFVSINIVS